MKKIVWPTKTLRAERAEQWRQVARSYAMHGESFREEHELCLALSEYWQLPLLVCILISPWAIRDLKKLMAMKEHRRPK